VLLPFASALLAMAPGDDHPTTTPAPTAEPRWTDRPSGPVSGWVRIRLDVPEPPAGQVGEEFLMVSVGGIGVRSDWSYAAQRFREEPGGPLRTTARADWPFDTGRLPDGTHQVVLARRTTFAPGRPSAVRWEELARWPIEVRNRDHTAGPVPAAPPAPEFGGRPVILRSVYSADATKPEVAAILKAAGCNAAEAQVYYGAGSLANNLERLDGILDAPRRARLTLLGLGDNFTGNPEPRDRLKTPEGTEMARALLARLAESGICPIVEVADEATRVMNPDEAAAVASLLRQAEPRPSLGFPLFSLHGPDALARYESQGDYISLNASPPGWPQTWRDLAPYRLQDLAPRLGWARCYAGDRPLGFTNLTICGDAQGIFPDDAAPASITACALAAVARGATILRAYFYDTDAAGQKGASPELGADRWAALSAAYNLIGELEPELLQPYAPEPDLGRDLIVGARSGPLSDLLLVVNAATVGREISIDPAPATRNGRGRWEGRRVLGAAVARSEGDGPAPIRLLLRPGEAAVISWPERPAP